MLVAELLECAGCLDGEEPFWPDAEVCAELERQDLRQGALALHHLVELRVVDLEVLRALVGSYTVVGEELAHQRA